MAIVAISALPASTTIASTDILPGVIGGVTKRITAGNFRTQIFAFGASDPLNCGILTATGNSSITGTLSGITTLNVGAVNAGGDLLFTDGLYDIGKSGATRPRDGFFSRNVTVLNGLNVGGVIVPSDKITGVANKRLLIGATYIGQYSPNYGETGYNTDDGNYVNTDFASRVRYEAGGFFFQTAPSGAALAAITFTTRWSITQPGALVCGTAVGKIVGGATSLSLRNNGDSADNLIITDAGAATLRAGLTVSAGNVVLSGSQVIQINGTNVVGPRAAGWTAQTTAQSRADMGAAPAAATVYQTLAALVNDLRGHGLI